MTDNNKRGMIDNHDKLPISDPPIKVKVKNEFLIEQRDVIVQGDLIVAKTIEDVRGLEQEYVDGLVGGKYKGAQVLGYYEEGDTPAPIIYYLSDTTAEDDGGSVIDVGEVKLEHEFNNEVNVLYFGVSENIADNKASIDTAITYCESLTLQTHESSVKLLFPYTSEGYRTTGGHKVGRFIDVVMEGMVIDITTSSNITFEIGDATIAGANPNRKHLLRVKRLNEVRSNFVDENDIGIILHNEYYSNSIVDYVRGFGIGFRLGGSGFGSSYNKYTLGLIANNYVGVDLYSTGTGWVNENTFIGGEFTVYSNLRSNQKIGVRSHAEGTYYNNSNLFLKPSFEVYDNNEVPGSYPVQIRGRYNRVLDARNEIGTTKGDMVAVKELGELTGENTYHFSYCDSFPLIDSEYPNQNSIIEVQNGDFQYKTVKLYDSGNVASNIWVTNNKIWSEYFMFCNISTGIVSNPVTATGTTITPDKYISTYHAPCVEVDTSVMKKLSYDLVSYEGATLNRVFFKLYDSEGSEITDISNIKGGGTTRLSSFGGCFGATQNLFPFKKGLRNVAFSESVKRVIVIFQGDRLSQFSLYTSDLKHGAITYNNGITRPTNVSKVRVVANTDYTLTPTDDIVEFQGLTANRTAVLPSANTVQEGKIFTIKASGANSFSLTITGGIEGISSFVLNSQYSTLTIYSNGTSWRLFNSYTLATSTTKGLVNQSANVTNITTADATDLATALVLVNELKSKLNAKLTADRTSGQQATP